MQKNSFIVAVLAVFAANGSIAEQDGAAAASEKDRIDEEITVTASGREDELFNLPVTIDTVSGDEAQSDKATWIGETVNRMPGVFFTQLRGPVDAPAIRLPVSYDNVYLYLQDNVPLQSPISFNHAAFSYSGALTSFGGMEILKGPGTALHGSDALAAVVNVKSKKPVFEPETLITIRGGENNLQDYRIDTSRGLTDAHAYRVALSYQQDDGWRESTAWERTQLIARHLYEHNEWEINTNFTWTDFDSQMAGTLSPADLANNPESDGLDPEVDRDLARDMAEYTRLHSEIYRQLNDRIAIQITPYYRVIDAQYMHTWEPETTPVTNTDTTTTGLLSRAYFEWNTNSTTVIGFDVEDTLFEQLTVQSRPTRTVFGTVFPQGTHLNYIVDYLSLAPYIEHTQNLTDKLSLVLGLRHERSNYDYRNNLDASDFTVTEPSPFLLLTEREDEFSEALPKLSLNYRFSDHHNGYFRYAEGFRIPDATNLYVLNPSQAEFELEPEKIQSYEIGYRGWLGETTSLNASIYHMVKEDGIVAGIQTPAGDISANGGEEEYEGLELGFQTQLTSSLQLTVAAAFTDNRVTQKLADGPSPVDSKTLISSPDPIGNIRLLYESQALMGLAVELEMQHIGSWYLDEANTLKTGAEQIFNLRADYGLDEIWSFNIKVANVFDEDYIQTAEAPVWAPDGIFRPGSPRLISAGLEALF